MWQRCSFLPMQNQRNVITRRCHGPLGRSHSCEIPFRDTNTALPSNVDDAALSSTEVLGGENDPILPQKIDACPPFPPFRAMPSLNPSIKNLPTKHRALSVVFSLSACLEKQPHSWLMPKEGKTVRLVPFFSSSNGSRPWSSGTLRFHPSF